MKSALCLFLFILLFSFPVHAATYRVVAVADGDTLTVEPLGGGNRSKVRLHGVDAPEVRQPYGQAAKTFTANTVLYKTVTVHPSSQGTDRYGRIVGVVEIPGGDVLQELLLDAGLAWVWPRYCKNCTEWEAIQSKAKAQKKGLWADKGPQEPWEWRSTNRARSTKRD